MDHKNFLKTLNAQDKARLNARSYVHGLRHLMLYCAVLGVTGSWIYFALPLWQIMMIPHGILIAFLFTLQHECTHNTPLETHWLNSAIGHLIAFLLFQPFLLFRYFHLAHHKYTYISGKDPELDGHEKPCSWGAFLRSSEQNGLLVGQAHDIDREQPWAAYCILYSTAQTAGPAYRSGAVDYGLCRCFCDGAHHPDVAVDCTADPWVSRVAPVPIGRTRTLPRARGYVFKHTYDADNTYRAVYSVEYAVSRRTPCDAIGTVS